MCTCLLVVQAVKHSIFQDDGAGGQAAEEMGEVNQEKESRATEWETEGRWHRRGSPAQLPVVCGLGLTALDRRGGRSHVLSSSPWVPSQL